MPFKRAAMQFEAEERPTAGIVHYADRPKKGEKLYVKVYAGNSSNLVIAVSNLDSYRKNI